MKEPGKILISIGWVLVVISIIAVIGMILEPNSRDPSIEAFLKHPDSLSLAGTVGVIIGSNALSLFAMGFGIYAVVKKNRKGKPLLITSVVVFLVISCIQFFLPSSESANTKQFSPLLVTIPQSEFQVTFPHPVERKIATSGGVETIAYESRGPCANPYLRAEFINDIDTIYVERNFRAVLDNYARLAGLKLPEITESDSHLGKVGTYSGVKIVGDHTAKFYGKIVLGGSSALNCLICENLEDFPSEDTVGFLVSLERK